MKKLLSIVLVFTSSLIISQTRCELDEGASNDLNVISVKKCLIKPTDNKVNNKVRTIKSTNNIITRYKIIRKASTKNKVLGLKNIKNFGVANKALNTELEVESLVAFTKEYKVVESFNTVDRIPAFRVCKKSSSKEDMKFCFNTQLVNFVEDNLFYPEDLDEGISGVVAINFVINKEGKVNNIRVTGDKNIRTLKEEIIDLIYQLPKMKPAVKAGENVAVEFDFLLNFSL